MCGEGTQQALWRQNRKHLPDQMDGIRLWNYLSLHDIFTVLGYDSQSRAWFWNVWGLIYWALAGAMAHLRVLQLVCAEVWAKLVTLTLLLRDSCRYNRRACPQLWEWRGFFLCWETYLPEPRPCSSSLPRTIAFLNLKDFKNHPISKSFARWKTMTQKDQVCVWGKPEAEPRLEPKTIT